MNRRLTPDSGPDTAWTQGLRTRTANLLLRAGYRSRRELELAPQRRLLALPGLGPDGRAEVARWLEPERGSRPAAPASGRGDACDGRLA